MVNKLGIVSTLLVFSSLVLAGNLSVKVENQVINAKVCNLPQGVKEVYFQVGQKGYAKNGIEQRENSMTNGCANKSYNNASNDLFLKGGEVVASYTNKDGKKIVMNADIPAKIPTLPDPPVTPRPGTPPVVVTPRPGTPPVPQPPTIPEKKMTPDDKVRTYGEQAANFMANRVVEIYGRVENYRYHFYKGFRKQASLYSNLGIAVENLPEYQYGYQNGQSQGGAEGYQAGLNEGNRVGSSMGQQEARSRFQNAIGNEASLNVASGEQPSGNDYQGAQSPLAQPDFVSQLNEYNNDFMMEARSGIGIGNEFDDEILSDVYGHYWNLSDYYSWTDYKYDTVFSNWKADNAFTLLLNRKLVRENSDPGKVQANNQMVTKYKEITNPDEYADADDSRQQYRYEFVKQYNEVIGRKWNAEVYGRYNPSAEIRGEFYFVQAIKAYAQKLGRARGYGVSYQSASRQGFQKTVGAAYKSSFDQTVIHYTNNAIIENVRVQLKNQSGQSSYAILDSMFPTVLEATNFGRVAGNVEVTLSGAGLSPIAASGATSVAVPGLTRMATAKMLGTPAQVAQSAKPNQLLTVNIQVKAGNYVINQSQQVTISWNQTVKQLSVESNASREAIMAQYVASQLALEWKEFGMFDGNPYEKKPLETLAGQYVQMIQSLPAAEQQKLKKYNSSFTAGYGKKPWVFSGKWKSVESLFKQIGYKMP